MRLSDPMAEQAPLLIFRGAQPGRGGPVADPPTGPRSEIRGQVRQPDHPCTMLRLKKISFLVGNTGVSDYFLPASEVSTIDQDPVNARSSVKI